MGLMALWVGDRVSCSMARTFDVLEQKHAEIVRESWALAKAKTETIDLGESIFKELASVAPYLVHLFKRPKRIQAAQFVSAIDLLVPSLSRPFVSPFPFPSTLDHSLAWHQQSSPRYRMCEPLCCLPTAPDKPNRG